MTTKKQTFARARNFAKMRISGAITIKHLCKKDFFTNSVILTKEEIAKVIQATDLLASIIKNWDKEDKK